MKLVAMVLPSGAKNIRPRLYHGWGREDAYTLFRINICPFNDDEVRKCVSIGSGQF